MEKRNAEITEKKKKIDGRKLLPQLYKKGQSGNLKGRPVGTRNWDTVYWQAIKRLAKKNSIKPDDLDLELVEKGIMEARKGNFNFWKEIKEANYGKVKEHVEYSGNLTISEFLNKINEINK